MKPPEGSPGVRRAIAALVLAWMVAGAVAAVEVNRIVLRVNNRIVTLFDYEQRKQARIDAIRRAELSPEQRQELLDGVGEEVLRTLFEEMLRRVDDVELLGGVEYSNLGVGSPIVVSPRALPVRLKPR